MHLAESLGLQAATTKTIVTALVVPDNVDVLFLLSVPATLKDSLLRTARLLIYTPPDEHFGIVPLEAMLNGVPVLAANSGGPLESIIEGETGWLRDVEEPDQWTQVMVRVLSGEADEEMDRMRRNGPSRVRSEYSQEKMAERLESEMESIRGSPKRKTELVAWLGIAGVGVGALGVAAAWLSVSL